jgi:hypothetical protein
MISHRPDQTEGIDGENLSEAFGARQTNNTHKLVLKTLIAKEKETAGLVHHFAYDSHLD